MMWPRKQLDIGWSDIAYGLWQTFAAWRKPRPADVVGTSWIAADEVIFSLSVRSAWDLLLGALGLPVGSEVITSAVTIPDMVRIIERHGLVPVPVDVDAPRLEVDVDEIERSITPRTRVILVAHLFGSHMEMAPIIELARRHDLIVVEDCAQAFVGHEYAGHSGSDCVLFSFGPIKTATALGGAIVRVPDEDLRAHMAQLQQSYPVQSRSAYLRRLLKYAAFCFLCRPRIYGWLVRLLEWNGIDYDLALGNAAHSFGASEFFTQIRRQPSLPLLKVLGRRVKDAGHAGAARLRRRTARGNELASVLRDGLLVGEQNGTHTFWVTPIRVRNGAEVIRQLRKADFDATALSSLIVVPPPTPISMRDPRESECQSHSAWLKEVVFLPSGDHMSRSEWQRQAAILHQLAEVVEPVPDPAPQRELAPLAGVSSTS